MATTYRTSSVRDTDDRVPTSVDHAVAGLTALTGHADAIDALLPTDLAPVRLPGGTGVVLVLAVDHLDNPLGACDEVVGLAARPVGMGGGPVRETLDVLRGRFGVWIQHMAVSQAFPPGGRREDRGHPTTLDEVELGDHEVADELRGLGLGRRPLAAAWLSNVWMRCNTAAALHRTTGRAA